MGGVYTARRRGTPIRADDLLAELTPNTDLRVLVRRVAEAELPAVIAWERRDPEGWTKVCAWLVARGVAVVQI
jgi:hypothetical protein